MLDILISESDNGYHDNNSAWYHQKLGNEYICPHSEKLYGPHFTSGVIKIQNEDESNTTHQEEEACARQLINNTNVYTGENVIDSFQERMAQRKIRKQARW